MQNPQRLLMLEAVLASGSLHAAARNLNYSPATISQHMKQLAHDTGLQLFTREGRGIIPTESARELVAEASPVLADLRRLDRTIAALREAPDEHLVISCFSSAAQAWLPGVIDAVRREHPQVTVEVSLNEPIDGQSSRPADLDIRNEPLGDAHDAVPLTLPGYDRHPLIEDEYLLVLPPGHALAGQEVVALQELQDEPWIGHDVHEGPTSRVIATACRAAGFTPGHVARLDDHHAALALVEAGIGVAVLPRLALAGVSDRLTLQRLTAPEVRRRVVAHARRGARPGSVAHRALEALTEVVRRETGEG